MIGATHTRKIATAFLAALILGQCHEARSKVLESARVRMLVAIDYRSKLQGIRMNFGYAESMREAFKGLLIPCTFDTIDGDHVSPGAILNHYKNLDIQPNDTLLFYYTGHGGTDPRFGHYLATSGGKILRSSVRGAMAEKNPHLAILLTDCCSLSGTMDGAFAPGFPLPPEKLIKDLFLRHAGVVDITAASYRGPANAEAAFFVPNHGGVFADAMDSVIHNFEFARLDVNHDGFFSWTEMLPVLSERSDHFFKEYKRMVLAGTIRIGDQDGLNRLLRQKTQTPQAFELGSKFTAPVEQSPERKPRLGAIIRENDGFGVMVDQVVDGTPASRIRVLGQVNGAPIVRIAPLVHGDTIRVANGVPIHNTESFLRVLDAVPPRGTLRIEGSDSGDPLLSPYTAEILLDR